MRLQDNHYFLTGISPTLSPSATGDGMPHRPRSPKCARGGVSFAFQQERLHHFAGDGQEGSEMPWDLCILEHPFIDNCHLREHDCPSSLVPCICDLPRLLPFLAEWSKRHQPRTTPPWLSLLSSQTFPVPYNATCTQTLIWESTSQMLDWQ